MSKKNITITLSRSELLYDIKDKTHLVGRGKDDARKGYHVTATDDEHRLALIRRSMGTAFGDLRAAVSEFAPIGGTVSSNGLAPAEGDVMLTLQLPTNYNDGVTDGLTAAMHRYIINRALGEWFAVTDTTGADAWMKAAANDLLEVRRLVLTRKRPSRRTWCDCGGSGVTPTTSNIWDDGEVWDDAVLWSESESYTEWNTIPSGGGSSTDNNFTAALMTKLNGIEEGAEVNVQADWSVTDEESDAYIANKPTITVDTTTTTLEIT